jgi:FkbH-like protein
MVALRRLKSISNPERKKKHHDRHSPAETVRKSDRGNVLLNSGEYTSSMATELTIQFIRNYTAEPIGNAIQEAAKPVGLSVKASFGAYDNLGTEIASLSSNQEAPSFAILTISLDYFSGGIFSPNWNRAEVINDFKRLLDAIDTLSDKTFVLVSTFIPPFRTSLPSAPNHPVLGGEAAVFELNAIIRNFVAERSNRCGILDFERIAARLGESATFDRRFGLMMKAPFKQEFVTAAAEEVMRFLRCRFLPPKKVLVLDCDNTLWGGVIGESGLEKIQLDPYDYPGIAFYRFQSEILSIAEKGFLICLCSKNDESSVWQVLDEHEHCLLRRNHVAAHRINWNDKATNIKELALELNLSVDSFVFVDDEAAECALIKSQFPEVSVIQFPTKVYECNGMLNASGFFDRISVNKEDKERTHYYQAEQGRRELQKRNVDAQSFLRDLKMKAAVRPMSNSDISRASQLCQRTNQFNLTSKRYTEADIASCLDHPDVRMFLLQAEDRFGPIGLSGLIMFRKLNGTVEVDTFLMSCRVIGRLFDRALFSESLRLLCRDWSFQTVKATFVPTPKNKIVSNLWREYGFSPEPGGDVESYTCPVKDLNVPFPGIMELVQSL